MICKSLKVLPIIGAAMILGTTNAPATLALGSGSSSDISAMCMFRPSVDEDQQPTRTVAPRAAQSFLEAKGFTEFDCGTEGFGAQQQIEFRNFVCQAAADQTEGLQRQLEHSLGARPATLCAMAEVVLGSWQGSDQ